MISDDNKKYQPGRRKGILFSLSMAFALLSMLSLVALINSSEAASSGRAARSLEHALVIDTASSVEAGLRSILMGQGVVVKYNRTYAVINETLPSGTYSGWSDLAGKWVGFVGNFSHLSISASLGTSAMNVLLAPAGINYSHASGFGSGRVEVRTGSLAAVSTFDVKARIPVSGVINYSLASGSDMTVSFDISTANATWQSTQALSSTAQSNITAGSLTITIGSAASPGLIIYQVSSGSANMSTGFAFSSSALQNASVSAGISSLTLAVASLPYNISYFGNVSVGSLLG